MTRGICFTSNDMTTALFGFRTGSNLPVTRCCGSCWDAPQVVRFRLIQVVILLPEVEQEMGVDRENLVSRLVISACHRCDLFEPFQAQDGQPDVWRTTSGANGECLRNFSVLRFPIFFLGKGCSGRGKWGDGRGGLGVGGRLWKSHLKYGAHSLPRCLVWLAVTGAHMHTWVVKLKTGSGAKPEVVAFLCARECVRGLCALLISFHAS